MLYFESQKLWKCPMFLAGVESTTGEGRLLRLLFSQIVAHPEDQVVV